MKGFEKVTEMRQINLSDALSVLVAHARLIQAGRDVQTHVHFLTAKLHDKEERIAACAGKLLLECQVQNETRKQVLDRLFNLMETGQNAWALDVVEEALQFMGPADKAYVPQLMRYIGPFPDFAVITALGRIGPDARPALPQLKPLLQYKANGADAFQALHGTLDPETQAVRKAVAAAIRRIEMPADANKPDA